jgi:hypothetical protein
MQELAHIHHCHHFVNDKLVRTTNPRKTSVDLRRHASTPTPAKLVWTCDDTPVTLSAEGRDTETMTGVNGRCFIEQSALLRDIHRVSHDSVPLL